MHQDTFPTSLKPCYCRTAISIGNRLYLFVESVMNQQETMILESATPGFLKIQWRLQRLVGVLRLLPCEVLTKPLKSTEKELCLVVTNKGKARHGKQHIRPEKRLIAPFQVYSLRIGSIIIESGRDISVITEETVKIVLGIHQPLGIAIQRNYQTGVLAVKQVEFV